MKKLLIALTLLAVSPLTWASDLFCDGDVMDLFVPTGTEILGDCNTVTNTPITVVHGFPVMLRIQVYNPTGDLYVNDVSAFSTAINPAVPGGDLDAGEWEVVATYGEGPQEGEFLEALTFRLGPAGPGTAEEAIDLVQAALEAYIDSGDVTRQVNLLRGRLRQAENSLAKDKPAQAVKKLERFISTLEKQVAKGRINPLVADDLISQTQIAIDLI